jgi:hypothetical protein
MDYRVRRVKSVVWIMIVWIAFVVLTGGLVRGLAGGEHEEAKHSLHEH